MTLQEQVALAWTQANVAKQLLEEAKQLVITREMLYNNHVMMWKLAKRDADNERLSKTIFHTEFDMTGKREP